MRREIKNYTSRTIFNYKNQIVLSILLVQDGLNYKTSISNKFIMK